MAIWLKYVTEVVYSLVVIKSSDCVNDGLSRYGAEYTNTLVACRGG